MAHGPGLFDAALCPHTDHLHRELGEQSGGLANALIYCRSAIRFWMAQSQHPEAL